MPSSQWTDLIKIDKKTPLLILGMIQYSTIYIILIFFVTSFIDSLFTYNEEKHHFNLLIEIVAQLLINILAIYYVRRISKLFPPLFAIDSDVFFRNTQNVMFITFILAALQPNLMNKIKGARA